MISCHILNKYTYLYMILESEVLYPSLNEGFLDYLSLVTQKSQIYPRCNPFSVLQGKLISKQLQYTMTSAVI